MRLLDWILGRESEATRLARERAAIAKRDLQRAKGDLDKVLDGYRRAADPVEELVEALRGDNRKSKHGPSRRDN